MSATPETIWQMLGCTVVQNGYTLRAYGPSELHPAPENLNKALACAKDHGATIEVSSNPACLVDADVIYTDVWVSMGEEDQL